MGWRSRAAAEVTEAVAPAASRGWGAWFGRQVRNLGIATGLITAAGTGAYLTNQTRSPEERERQAVYNQQDQVNQQDPGTIRTNQRAAEDLARANVPPATAPIPIPSGEGPLGIAREAVATTRTGNYVSIAPRDGYNINTQADIIFRRQTGDEIFRAGQYTVDRDGRITLQSQSGPTADINTVVVGITGPQGQRQVNIRNYGAN